MNRLKKSESLREKLSCVGSHSTDSFDRRNSRTNLNDYLNNEAPASYFQQLIKHHNSNPPQRSYPQPYSYTLSSIGNHRQTKDQKFSKNQKKLVYADLALSNHNMKFKNTVHSKRQLYGNYVVQQDSLENSRYEENNLSNNNQRKVNQTPRNEQDCVKYNEIDV